MIVTKALARNFGETFKKKKQEAKERPPATATAKKPTTPTASGPCKELKSTKKDDPVTSVQNTLTDISTMLSTWEYSDKTFKKVVEKILELDLVINALESSSFILGDTAKKSLKTDLTILFESDKIIDKLKGLKIPDENKQKCKEILDSLAKIADVDFPEEAERYSP